MPPTAHPRPSRDDARGRPPTLVGLALVVLGLGLVVACATAPEPDGAAGTRPTTLQRAPETERALAERGDADAIMSWDSRTSRARTFPEIPAKRPGGSGARPSRAIPAPPVNSAAC